MNSLKITLSAVASAAPKGKRKQLSFPVASFARNLSSSSSPTAAAAAAAPSATPSASTSSSSSSAAAASSSVDALALLKSQPSHYAIASITGRTYLVSKGDLVTVPRLKDAQVGDLLVLDKIHEIGSRDYTLRAQDTLNTRRISTAVDLASSTSSSIASTLQGVSPAILPQPRRLFTRIIDSAAATKRSQLLPLADTWSSRLLPSGLAHIGASLPPTTVKVTAVVTENTKGALERIVKKKRRKGYKKTVQHKQPYTRLRIEQIEIQPN
ncbi:related to MRPL49 - mitochondrial ribosomal protein of the large subunit [Melanopsichium pennsylvanicum]|uniref:Large ribosomal subunit protein bL21m n=2 Tax=Melanopsichium pennsylvanicum TaxID=63383 RepID=A0AAJ4XT83_9BASI|nr:aconitase homoaconitase [Melanopsichium pennsylvanicum 4]SNX87462.1 related to MRPL49 - mitochondrial ribosomal protein of the large subunit [Melanopsichium pennsylvanicum]